MTVVTTLVRIVAAEPLEGYRVRLVLTTGKTIETDLGPLLRGPVFAEVCANPVRFRELSVSGGTLTWPGELDLDPDVVIGSATATDRPTARRARS